MKATNIDWEVDHEEDREGLPTEITIPEGMDEDEIGDYISDVTGFCHKGFVLEEDLYTILYDCDNGRNWEQLPLAKALDLLDNLGAYGVEELMIFAPDAHTVSVEEMEALAAKAN